MTAMDAVRALGAQKRALAVPAKAMILASIWGRMCSVPATRGPRRCSPRPIASTARSRQSTTGTRKKVADTLTGRQSNAEDLRSRHEVMGAARRTR